MSVAIIIPAYNEEQTIDKVINVAKTVDLVNRVIVVSDGSTDNTVKIAKKCGIKVIDLPNNVGKGGAMSVGVKNCTDDIIVFLDADLLGLTKEHIEELIKPMIEGKVDMTIGVFTKGRVGTDLAHTVAPFLSGQRALKRTLFMKISDIDISRFGVEVALTRYVKKHNIPFIKVNLDKLTHVTKEEKMGFSKGFRQRFKMYLEIIKSFNGTL
jgi:polyisoprenyl-phosphate glycosyltransferase